MDNQVESSEVELGNDAGPLRRQASRPMFPEVDLKIFVFQVIFQKREVLFHRPWNSFVPPSPGGKKAGGEGEKTQRFSRHVGSSYI